MKNFNIIYLISAILLFPACEEVLDVRTSSEWDDADVWHVPEIAEGTLMKAYMSIAQLPDNYSNNFLDAATDNALTNNFNSSVYKVAMGETTTSANPFGNWGTCYEQFQYIHSFLENGLTPNTVYNRTDAKLDSLIKSRLKGEAFFLRAWWGFELLKMYGGKTATGEALGYPIITHYITQDEAKNSTEFRRNTYAECAAQIIRDCDSAIVRLPATYTGEDIVTGATQIGRASKYSAGVLKSRVALYAASPAYQPDEIVKITGMGQYTIVNLAAYQKKWEYAALVADSVLQLSGFGNFTAMTAKNLADAGNTTPADFVFRKFFNSRALETRHFPPFYYGSAQTIPSQNLVDAFPAKNGFPASDPRSAIAPGTPYANRDNRLNLNIYYQGRVFGTTGLPIDVVAGGKDSEEYHPSCSRSGYYLAKFMSSKETLLNPTTATNAMHYNPLLRKSEVFINFAEAANEAWGPKEKGGFPTKFTAYDVIKTVRSSSGGITSTTYLDEMAAGANTFRQLIQDERRIEFTFEDQRYFDMRRWVLKLDEPVYGIVVERATDGTLTYTKKKIEDRRLSNIRDYYSPLPYDEVIKNKNLVNNVGWN